MGVLFPCDIDVWTEVSRRLHTIQQTSSPSVFPSLQEIYELIHGAAESGTPPAGVKKPFHGLEMFFKKEATYKEKTTFFQHTFPIIISHALQIESRKPEGGIHFSKQQTCSRTVISRQLAASIVACGFLCLWPRRKYDKHSTLCAINFDNFFCHLANKGQCGKVRMIIHYFERTSQDFLQGNVVFERKVVPQENLPTLDEWLQCETKLCDVQVHSAGLIEDSGPGTLQVDFANRKLGGGVLSAGRVQEEIRFSACPELIAGMLFMEEMQDNEAIVIHGFLNYSHYSGYAKDLAFVGPYNDPVQRDAAGNIDNHLVCVDACPAKRIGGAEKQYLRENVVRELNKAMVGFQQHRPKARQGSIGEVCKQYFSTLSETIFTKALGDILTTQEPTPPSLGDQNIVRQRRRRSADVPSAGRRNSGSDSSITAQHSLPRGHSLDSPMISSRRSSSDISSRRGSSSESISSRRGSSFSSSSSRRSSSRKGSSECSDMEEYLQTIATRSQKPSVIEEEEAEENPIHDFAGDLVASVFQQGIPESQEILNKPPVVEPVELPTFSSECPDIKTKPKPMSPPRQISHADLSQIFTFATDFTDELLKDAMGDVKVKLMEQEHVQKQKATVEPLVDDMLGGVWNDVLRGIKEGRVRVVQVDDEDSDVEDIDLDLFMFVDDFVHGVMDEALESYKAEVREEQQQLEEMLQRSRLKVETEARYFHAEFSRQDTSGHKIDRRKGSLNYVRGGLAREMMRRRSLDETGRRRNSGFKDKTLSSFENELRTSHPNIPNFVLSSAGRRASEPMTRDDSIDTDFLSVASEKTRASSTESVSKDYLQGWLENCQNLSERSSRNRQRTSSSHLDWFAQDLVLDALDDAYVQMFGQDYTTRNKTDMASTSSSSKDEHHDHQTHREIYSSSDSNTDSSSKTVRHEAMPIVTGNWGCGAYRGDPQLKSLLQWMTASRTNTPVMIYYTFSHENLIHLEPLCHLISSKGLTVGQLLSKVMHYCDRRQKFKKKDQSLFEVLQSLL